MKTTVVNDITRPDLWNFAQDKLDAEGQAIPILDADGVDTGKVEQEYTVKAIVDKASIVDYDIVKRKSAKGIAEFRSYAEQTEIWHEIDGKKFKLADHAFYLEYLDGEKWIRSKGSATQIDETSIEAQDDIIRADVDSETGKYTFTLGKKGYTIRGVWVIRRYDVYGDCFDDLRLDTSDYTGNIDDSDWVQDVRTIVFESKGIKDKLVVDPYISIATSSTTITCTFDSGDAVVWTISDEDAVLKESNTLRAVIHENYFEWTVYDEYMVRWQHDTGAITTGAAFTSNTYCTDANKVQIGSYNYYFYPATSANDTNSTALAAELADITITQNTGSAVTDRHWPGKIASGTSGACYDGAFHVTSDSNNAGKFTMDRARALFATVIEDRPVMSGDPASPTTHDTCRLKCGDNTASSTIVAATGSNANWEAVSDGANRNTNTSGDHVDGASGSGLNTQDGTAYIDMSLTGHANAFFKTGAIKIGMQPQFSYDDAADQTLFHVYISANDYLMCWYDVGNDRFEFIVAWGGTTATVNLTAHTVDGTLQVFDTIWCAWDSDNNNIAIWNGRETDVDSNSGTPSASNPSKFTIGAKQDRSLPGDFILDDLLTLSDCIRNHGTFIPANIISGDVGYDMAHDDILLYWDGSDCIGTNVQIGGVQGTLGSSNTGGVTSFPTSGGIDGSGYFDNGGYAGDRFLSFPVTLNDIVNFSKGSSSFWIYFTETRGSRGIFTLYVDDDNYLEIQTGSDQDTIYTAYRAGGTGSPLSRSLSQTLTLNKWHHFYVKWESGDYGHKVIINGILEVAYNTFTGTFSGSTGYIYLGKRHDSYSGDVYISKVTITSNHNTPQLWTANGKPLILMDFKSEVA